MADIQATLLRRGTTILYEKTPYKVLEFEHRTPARQRGFVDTKLRNLIDGTQRRVKPSDDFQTVIVYTQDLKFYWSLAGKTDATRMNLNDLQTFSLGIARKAENQGERGTLYVKSVRLLGANN